MKDRRLIIPVIPNANVDASEDATKNRLRRIPGPRDPYAESVSRFTNPFDTSHDSTGDEDAMIDLNFYDNLIGHGVSSTFGLGDFSSSSEGTAGEREDRDAFLTSRGPPPSTCGFDKTTKKNDKASKGIDPSSNLGIIDEEASAANGFPKYRMAHLTHHTPAQHGFHHTELDYETSSIRVLTVLPALSPDGLIQCTVVHTNINDRYMCLSYTWGQTGTWRDGSGILINSRSYSVRKNLLDFLQVRRPEGLALGSGPQISKCHCDRMLIPCR
jgi:hypothetical protein